jgi:hypothetical protein
VLLPPKRRRRTTERTRAWSSARWKGNTVIDRVAGRNDDNAIGLIVFFKRFQHLQAGAAGQADVEQDTVVLIYPGLLQSGVVIGSSFHHVVLHLQGACNGVEEFFFVFYDQYFHGVRVK